MVDKSAIKVIVGMSGGVDSSVAALLLKQHGYQVEGLFMKNWEDDETDKHCSVEDDFADARAVCATLGIKLHSVNFAKEYWDNVFSHFLTEYRAGRTPNPDILCNKEIKFNAFLNYALDLGADYIATGHYVRRQKRDGHFHLLRGVDNNKDQSYFLYTLNQYQLSKSLFPIGELEKPLVRKIALDAGLITHNKKDSTGICFIGERKFKSFLQEYLLAQPGDMETPEGKKIATHDGLMYYTLGQRQGLKIGGRKEAIDAPWFVVDKDIKRNVLIVAQGHDHPLLLNIALVCTDLHWTTTEPTFPYVCTAKTRYRQSDAPCVITKQDNDQCIVEFNAQQWAMTPGQSVVFYQQERCIGGGVITANLRLDKALTNDLSTLEL